MCSYVKLQAASAYFVGRWVGLYTCVFRCAETVKNRYYCVSYFFAKTDYIINIIVKKHIFSIMLSAVCILICRPNTV